MAPLQPLQSCGSGTISNSQQDTISKIAHMTTLRLLRHALDARINEPNTGKPPTAPNLNLAVTSESRPTLDSAHEISISAPAVTRYTTASLLHLGPRPQRRGQDVLPKGQRAHHGTHRVQPGHP